ncbi:hypothetical protein [Maribacter sp. IgM3_T14_3]|uniref:hypothetical protein n=1 Tax=Maribacter sp. IgM3_T14_3 TaxID=3415140 RepID=UPI003C6F3C3D
MADIIDINYLSTGFPVKQWKDLIERENFIDSISSKFENDNRIVYLSGEEGTGKTTLLGQFCKKYFKNSFSLFFNPYHSIDLDINFLRSNLHDQIQCYLGKPELINEDESFVTKEKYRLAWFNLKKKQKNSRQKIYLIIDGLESRGASNEKTIKELLKVIPFGEDYLNVIISGSPDYFKGVHSDLLSVKAEEISMIGFTNHQSREFLGSETLSVIGDRDDLIKATKGYPNRLEVLKRLISDGTEIEEISNTNNFQSWIDLDTNKIDLEEPIVSLLLSLLALSDKRLSILELSKISETSEEEISIKINGTHVLEKVGETIQFISLAHAKYFKSLLRGKQRQVDNLFIRYYGSSDALRDKFELTKIYASQKNWSKIPSIINEKFLEETIKDSGSIEKVNESIDLGFQSSQEMKKYSQVYKYCVQGSIVNELDNYLFWESEIQARIALNDFVGAINLAERAVLKSDRLRLLSLVARKQKELNSKVDDELITLIKDLYNTTNLAGIGNSIYDIVANLIYSIPNLAIEILDKTTGSSSESNINDWVVAKLSLAAINSEEKEESEKEVKLKALEKLNNPSVKKIHRAISMMVGDYSSKRVLEEVSKLNDSGERLKLLRLWLKNNRSHNMNIKKVMLVTLDELVSSSGQSDSILDTLIDLSSQMYRLKNYSDKSQLLERFKDFEKNIKQVGLKKDLYNYRLNVFQAQYSLRKDKAEKSLLDIINDVEKIQDKLIQIECFCEVFYRLSLVKDFNLTNYYNKVYGRIKTGVTKLLQESANHVKITENILEIIGKVNPKFAIEICEKINTQYARDTGRLKMIDSYLDNSLKKIKANDLKAIVTSFETEICKEISIQAILERFSNSKSLPEGVLRSILPYVMQVKSIKRNSIRLSCAILSFKVISKNSNWKNKLFDGQKRNLLSIWNDVEAEWDKINAGYKIASEISAIDSIFAKEIFDKTTEIKNQSWLDSKSVANTYLQCLRLIIKAYSALLKNKLDKTKDFEGIKGLIDRVPSENEKLLLWSEIAISSIICDNYNISKRIYENHIMPLVTEVIRNNTGIYRVLECFVVIHNFNSDLAFEYLNKLSEDYKEKACVIISDFYITRKSPFEVYDGEIYNFKTSYDNILKAVRILSEMNTDQGIYYQIMDIAKAIKENADITNVQKTEIRGKIEKIIYNKLPDQNNIKHEGYKILSIVQLEIISKSNLDYEAIVKDSQKIPNLSDRIFVKGVLLSEIFFDKFPDLKKQLVDEVYDELSKLSSHYEFMERVTELSKTMYSLSRSRWQEIVNQAFDNSRNFDEGHEMYSYQKNILDSIYRIDEKFAKTLVNRSKKNMAEINKELLQNYYETLELSKKIRNNQSLEENQKLNYRKIISAVMRAQGSLNSGKITTKKISDVAQYLKIGKTIGLSESFPVFIYYLSNSANLRLGGAGNTQIHESQREVFETMFNSIKLVELLSQNRKIEHSINTKVFIDSDFQENLLVRPNSREEALNYIRKWIVEEAESFLIVTDPYFRKEDVDILKFVKEMDSEIETIFIGCNDGSASNLEVEFESEWKRISDQEPPEAKVIFCWVPETPDFKLIHDRWIISKNGGLRLGTSYRSLGKGKDSEISIIKPNAAFNILEGTLRNYMENKTRYSEGKRIKYKRHYPINCVS